MICVLPASWWLFRGSFAKISTGRAQLQLSVPARYVHSEIGVTDFRCSDCGAAREPRRSDNTLRTVARVSVKAIQQLAVEVILDRAPRPPTEPPARSAADLRVAQAAPQGREVRS